MILRWFSQMRAKPDNFREILLFYFMGVLFFIHFFAKHGQEDQHFEIFPTTITKGYW